MGTRLLQMSMDAIFPLWKAGKSFFVHHSENVGLTTEFMNRLKLDDLPVVLALAAEAVKTTEDGKFLQNIERAFRSLYKYPPRNSIRHR